MKYLLTTPILILLAAGASADSVSYSATITPSSSLNVTQAIAGLHKFNPALGKLTSVSVSFLYGFDALGTVTGTGEAVQYKWHARAGLTSVGGDGDQFSSEAEEQDQIVKLTGNPINRTDSLFPRDGSGLPEWKTVNIGSGDDNGQSRFIGTDDISITFNGSASLETSGGEDNKKGKYSVTSTNYYGDVMVTYNFTPAPTSKVATQLGDSNFRYRFRSGNRKGYVAGAVCGKDGRWFPAVFKDGKLVATGPKGDPDCDSEGLSDDGTFFYRIPDNNGHEVSYRWKDKTVVADGVPGYKSFKRSDANAYGRFVGQGYKSDDKDDAGDAFFFDGKNYCQIQIPGLTKVCADGINANGDVLTHGYDRDGNCNFGVWNGGNWTPNNLKGKYVHPWVINEGGDVAATDDAGNIAILTCTKTSLIPAPKGATAELKSLNEDGSYAGTFHYSDHDEAFRGDDKGFRTLNDLANDLNHKYVRAEYVKNSGDLVGYDINGNCYKFDTASDNPASLSIPLWMISEASYKLTVSLTKVASQDTSYSLSYNGQLLSGPSSVTIAKGQASATVMVTAKSVSKQTPAVITATSGTDQHSVNTNLVPFTTGRVTGSNLGAGNNYIAEGTTETMNLHIATPAPDGGLTVNLFGDSTGYAKVPTSVFIATGSQDASFQIPTFNVDQNQRVIVTAQLGKSRITGTFTIHPVGVASLNGSMMKAKKGDTISFTVNLDAPAPAFGKFVNLSTSCGSISVPARLFIAAGQKSASFNGTVTDNDKETVTVNAGIGSASANWNVKIN